MSHLPAYRKTVAAVVGALLTWGAVVVTSDPSRITSSEWLLVAGSLATALGVYAAPNEESDEYEAGRSDLGSVLVIVVGVFLGLALFAWVSGR